MLYNKKLIKTGDIYHYYDYGTRYFKRGYTRDKATLPGVARTFREYGVDVGQGKRDSHVYRAKRNVKFICQTNAFRNGCKPIFITYTFAKDVVDLKYANRVFSKFIQRLNYSLGYRVGYVAVPEIQRERSLKYGVDVWHYHVLFFNLRFVPRIYDFMSETWGQGWSISKVVFSDVYHVGNYMSKYFTKQSKSDIPYKQKSYFCSRGLLRPVEVYGYDSELVDSSYIQLFRKEYIIKDYKLDYSMLEKWIK